LPILSASYGQKVNNRRTAMKVRIVEVEGSPQELAEMPELAQALTGHPTASALDEEEASNGGAGRLAYSPNGALPKELRDYIAVRSGSRERAATVESWVTEVLSWGTTEAQIGTSKTSSDGLGNYVRLYAKGPRYFGAFAYVTPGRGKVTFRLSAKAAKGFDHVALRKVQPGTGYEVTVTLDSDEARREALELAQKALAQVQEEA
jgi:hypothetical protein